MTEIAKGSRLIAWARIAALAALFLLCIGPHLVMRLTGRSAWPRRFLAATARIVGARVRVEGQPIAPHSLLLANHLSWLDIFVLGGATGTAFVSKAEVADNPKTRWFADQAHTLYIRRQQRRDVAAQAAQVAERLRNPRPLAIFPEGTTGKGSELLPFRASLLAAAADRTIVVRPVAIDYGAMTRDVAWHSGEPGLANAMRVLGQRGSFPVVVRLLVPLAPSSDRKAIASAASRAIANALGHDAPPFGPASDRL